MNPLKAALGAFLKSSAYTLTSVGGLFLLLAVTDGGNSPAAAFAWMQAHYWSFIVAQVIAPVLRAHAAANLYSPVPEKPGADS